MPFSTPPRPGETGTWDEVLAQSEALHLHQFDRAADRPDAGSGADPRGYWVWNHTYQDMRVGPRQERAPDTGPQSRHSIRNTYTDPRSAGSFRYVGPPYRPVVTVGNYIPSTALAWAGKLADGFEIHGTSLYPQGKFIARWDGEKLVLHSLNRDHGDYIFTHRHEGDWFVHAHVGEPVLRFQSPYENSAIPRCPGCHKSAVFRGDGTMMVHRAVDRTGPLCAAYFVAQTLKWVKTCPQCTGSMWAGSTGACPVCTSVQTRIHAEGAQPSDLRFGVEMETEGICYTRHAGKVVTEDLRPKSMVKAGLLWDAKGDGSLRGPNAEVVTPPLPFTPEGLAELREGAKRLRNAGSRVSERCGVHIHIDCNKLNIDQMRSLARHWVVFQDAVLAAQPILPHRRTYCQPMTVEHVHTAEDTQNRESWSVTPKYCTLNMSHWNPGRYGTVEFRLFNGTLHGGRLAAYVALCTHIVAYASRHVQDRPPARLPPTRAGMVTLLDTLGITSKSVRYHLLGAFKTDDDAPIPAGHVAPKRKANPLLARPKKVLVGDHLVVMSAREYIRLGLSAPVRGLGQSTRVRYRPDMRLYMERAVARQTHLEPSLWLNARGEPLRLANNPDREYNDDFRIVTIRRGDWDEAVLQGKVVMPPRPERFVGPVPSKKESIPGDVRF